MDKALHRIKLRLRAELDSFFIGGRRMERWIYWIRRVGKNCKGFCMWCRYYEVCKEDCLLNIRESSSDSSNFIKN